MTRSPAWRDPAILALMLSQTVIWAAIFYSFPALVLRWQAAFGWSVTGMMGAFTLALSIQGAAAPWMGRLIDRGHAPLAMPLGTLGAAAGLAALTQVEALWQFYAVWAWLGLVMAATLYDATFAIVTRAHGERARDGITAITLAAGFASTLAYPLVAAATAAWGWTAPVWILAALVLACVLPLHVFAARRLDAAARNRPPGPARRARSGADLRGRGTLRLAAAFGLAALGVAVMITLLLPLLAAFGVPDRLAVLSAAIVGPAQVIGRVVLLLAGARRAALGLTVSAFLLLGAAAVAMGAAAALPALALVFAAALGLGNGVVSILRPVVIREVLGEAGFGANAGVVARAWLWAFAAAPTLGALIADTAGYAAVVVLCVAAPLAGAAVLRPLST